MEFNSSLLGQNGHHFGRRHFQMYFSNENGRIPIQISLKFVPRSPIDNKQALVKVNSLTPNRWQAITWTHDGPVHWCIYAALGGYEFKHYLPKTLIQFAKDALFVEHLALVSMFVVVGDSLSQIARQLSVYHIFFYLLELQREKDKSIRCNNQF